MALTITGIVEMVVASFVAVYMLLVVSFSTSALSSWRISPGNSVPSVHGPMA